MALPGEDGMPNERLRSIFTESEYDEDSLAREIGLDPKSVQRWITRDVTPRRATAQRAARLRSPAVRKLRACDVRLSSSELCKNS